MALCGVVACSKQNPVWGLEGSDEGASTGLETSGLIPSESEGTNSGGSDGGTSDSTSTSGGSDPTIPSGTSGADATGSSGGVDDGGESTGAASDGASTGIDAGCEGEPSDGYCWYYGELGQNCNEVCGPHGGWDPGGTLYVGSNAPDETRCGTLMSLMGVDSPLFPVTVISGGGEGCYWIETYDQVHWESNVDTTENAAALNVRRPCACQQ